MQKKFVPLNADASPSKNPYEIRTYLGENTRPDWNPAVFMTERKCMPPNSTISKVLTIEDELRCLHQKAKDSRFKKPKKKCERLDDFTECVATQRTAHDLKVHARMRENYLHTKLVLNTRIHDGNKLKPKTPSIVALQNPMDGGEEEEESEKQQDSEEGEEEEEEKKVRVRLASPTPSMDIIYKPPQKLLELHRPKSGMYLNQSEPPELDDMAIPYSTYNPRLLQEQFDAQQLDKIDIIQGDQPNEGWTWNLGLQKRASELDRQYNLTINPDIDRNNIELRLYKIPTDLHKTFTAAMVFGNRAIPPPVISNRKPVLNRRPPEMAAMFVAYIESFHINPDFWVADTMDEILATAEALVKKSEKLNYKSTDNDFDILTTLTSRQAAIGLKVHYTGPIMGDPNLFKVLELYFSKYNAAVLVIKDLYLLIWKRCQKAFFVFDPNGRKESCLRDPEGKCALMSIPHVDHLVHLILGYCNCDKNSEFNLYEIFMINYGRLTVPVPTKPFPRTVTRRWVVVNRTYALIPGGNSGLQQPVNGKLSNASQIISLMALLYSDIQRAVSWQSGVIDDLVRFGQAYVKANIKKHKKSKHHPHKNIMDLPEQIVLGVYRATLKKGPFFFTGHIVECPRFQDSQVAFALRELLNSSWESALIQIDNSTLALWHDDDYFYVFDPFRRSRTGIVLDPEDFRTKGAACMQMHTDFDSLCRILYAKALAMRRGSKFFVHGINVGCIKPIHDFAYPRIQKFSNLKLTYPTFTEAEELAAAEKLKATKKSGKDAKKKKAGKLERKFSIQRVPTEELIPEYDDQDVVEGVIEEVIWSILHELPEDRIKRPHPYKQVEKVLLKSDKCYLKKLQYDLQHGQDIDNIYEKYQMKPDGGQPIMSLEEELMIPSNFVLLPDGTWIIFGTTTVPDNDTTKLCGLLSSLVTAAMCAKYKISTWTEKLVDFALTSVKNFGEEFNDYQKTLELVLSKRIPRIALGDDFFLLSVQKVLRSSTMRPLRQVLLECLISYNRVLVICQRFSCLIIKRYNFLYVFIGFPCNAVGYRKYSPGPPCMLRLIELDSLIRRIEFGCNPEGCDVTNFVLVALKVHDITNVPPERYRAWGESEEDDIVAAELKVYEKQRQRRLDKIYFLDQELRKENDRIKRFLTEKERRLQERRSAREQRCHPKRFAKRAKKRAGAFTDEEEYDEEIDEFDDEEEEEEEEVELKHKPGKRLKRMLESDFKPRPILYGYRLREKDYLYKIQGSTALEGRGQYSVHEIKACYFASIMAILFTILRPLNQWNSQRVDKVIESAKGIASKVTNMTTAFERVIKNVTVDDYEFDVWVKTHEPLGVWGSSVDRKIAKTTQTRKYLMLQTANATYAIYRDDYYHLFDPYPTMEKLQGNEEEEADGEEEENENKKLCPKDVRRYGERNTASWVLFVDIETMLEYIDQRSSNTDWKENDEFKLHIVDVISYKKASSKRRILQLLTDMSVPMTCETGHHGEFEAEICAHAESLNWIDLDNCLPIWSRMNRRNAAGKYRNLPVTKLKKYDIEIDGRLWSLWGTLHPTAVVFDASSRGKSHLACYVIACCAASVYRLADWSPQLLDSIVISGDKYHRQSVANIKRVDYEFSLEDLNIECTLEKIRFVLHIEHRTYGKLYCTPTRTRMNLAESMMYFFSHFQFGILQCEGRALAIGYCKGRDGGYFMYDCQSKEHPLFPKGQGATYVLRMSLLQVLLYCVVVTLNVPYYNVKFTIHQVSMLREGASLEQSEEEEEHEGDN